MGGNVHFSLFTLLCNVQIYCKIEISEKHNTGREGRVHPVLRGPQDAQGALARCWRSHHGRGSHRPRSSKFSPLRAHVLSASHGIRNLWFRPNFSNIVFYDTVAHPCCLLWGGGWVQGMGRGRLPQAPPLPHSVCVCGRGMVTLGWLVPAPGPPRPAGPWPPPPCGLSCSQEGACDQAGLSPQLRWPCACSTRP